MNSTCGECQANYFLLENPAKCRSEYHAIVADDEQDAPVSLEKASAPSENSSHDKPDKQAVEACGEHGHAEIKKLIWEARVQR